MGIKAEYKTNMDALHSAMSSRNAATEDQNKRDVGDETEQCSRIARRQQRRLKTRLRG